jgi:hypothetical protein
MWSNPAFLFLQEPLVHKQLLLITKTSLRGLDDSHHVIANMKLHHVLIDGGARLNVISHAAFKQLQILGS